MNNPLGAVARTLNSETRVLRCLASHGRVISVVGRRIGRHASWTSLFRTFRMRIQSPWVVRRPVREESLGTPFWSRSMGRWVASCSRPVTPSLQPRFPRWCPIMLRILPCTPARGWLSPPILLHQSSRQTTRPEEREKRTEGRREDGKREKPGSVTDVNH